MKPLSAWCVTALCLMAVTQCSNASTRPQKSGSFFNSTQRELIAELDDRGRRIVLRSTALDADEHRSLLSTFGEVTFHDSDLTDPRRTEILLRLGATLTPAQREEIRRFVCSDDPTAEARVRAAFGEALEQTTYKICVMARDMRSVRRGNALEDAWQASGGSCR